MLRVVLLCIVAVPLGAQSPPAFVTPSNGANFFVCAGSPITIPIGVTSSQDQTKLSLLSAPPKSTLSNAVASSGAGALTLFVAQWSWTPPYTFLGPVGVTLRASITPTVFTDRTFVVNVSSPVPTFTTPCGTTTNVQVQVPVVLEITAMGSPVGMPGSIVTLSATGTPPGGTWNPPLPMTASPGQPATSTMTWPPAHPVGTSFSINIIATNELGHSSSCVRDLFTTSECALLLGTAAISHPLLGGDVVLTNLDLPLIPVSMAMLPSFSIPDDPGLIGQRVFAQIYMYNPYEFPADPIQLSHGLDVIIGTGATAYGNGGSGITLWLDQRPLLGNTSTFCFDIPGM